MDGGGSDDCGGLKNRGEHWDKPEEEGGGRLCRDVTDITYTVH